MLQPAHVAGTAWPHVCFTGLLLCLHAACPAFSLALQDLADWRSRMNQQVESYRAELSGLQTSLSAEMSRLRGELADMKARIRQQMDSNTAVLGDLRQQGAGDAATEAALSAGGSTEPAAPARAKA